MITPEELPVAMRCLVGSHAYGLARPDSDYDYREVFVTPTSLLVGLGARPKDGWGNEPSKWTDDEGGWEIAKWLMMVRKGSPNATELLFAPLEDIDQDRAMNVDPLELRRMAMMLVTRTEVARATLGYATNSFRKIEGKQKKWLVGYLRSLLMGRDFLMKGEMDMPTEWNVLADVQAGKLSPGEVLDYGKSLEEQIADDWATSKHSALPESVSPEAEQAVNDWLMEIRKSNW